MCMKCEIVTSQNCGLICIIVCCVVKIKFHFCYFVDEILKGEPFK